MKSYSKNVFRTIIKNISRFILMTLITMVGIAFVTGVGGISPKVTNSFNENFKNTNVPDLIIKSKSLTGFSQEEIDKIKNNDIVSEIMPVSTFDTGSTRFYNYPFSDNSINKLKIVDGNFPIQTNDCVVEKKLAKMKDVKINDSLEFNGVTYKVTGIVDNPLIFVKSGEKSVIDSSDIDLIIYTYNENYPVITDIYVKLSACSEFGYFTKKYSKTVNEEIKKLDLDDYAVLTLNENLSYAFLKNITEKVDVIAAVFPLFFILVVALVVLTTMSRLIEEDRSTIGCLKSLGYGEFKIVLKYILFTVFSTIIGSVIGMFIGSVFLPTIIYEAFGGLFYVPKMTKVLSFAFGLISLLFMVVAAFVVTLYLSKKISHKNPPELFLPQAPKPGKKVFLERIGFVWKHLKFKYKSTFRNIFRYVGRLLMVVISVSGSTALVFAGLSLLDISDKPIMVSGFSFFIEDTLKAISIAIIAFSLALSILVLYNLTNMNIGERNREIATLKVLGYRDLEVYGYIFREIFIMSLMGTALGIPLGILLMFFIFNSLKFGGLDQISFATYMYSILSSILFTLLSFALLIRKINNVDMNDSLKSLE